VRLSPPRPSPFAARGAIPRFRLPEVSDQQYDALRAEQLASNRRDIERLRQWWLSEMSGGTAPLRENLDTLLRITGER
jgi:hypothetical protein